MSARYEYRVVGFDEGNGGDVPHDTFEYSALVGSLRAARAAKAAMKAEARELGLPYDDLWIERRVVPEWERV